MKEKNIFIGILVVALIGIGVFAYRTAYNGDKLPAQITPEGLTEVPPATTPSGAPASLTPTPANPAVTTPTANPVIQNKIVQYTDKGFSPQAITIKNGTTVMFTNAGKMNMWVASAPHPAHTDYPEFDSMRPVTSGYAYTFTFQRVGTWKYHNHVNPTHYGSVTVTE